MYLKNSTCQKFERHINNEIAAGQQFDFLKVEALKQQIITPQGKHLLGVHPEVQITMYDIVKGSVDVLSKLRFIYLLSLLEAFGMEFIAQREGVGLDDVATRLASYQSKWQRQQSGVLSSSSFLNLAYLGFILHEAYGIDFASVKTQCFWEAGVLRNCVVHYGGIIPNEAFRLGLKATIRELGSVDAVGSALVISDKLVWAHIEAARAFLHACDV
jgi:hypothetical protein